MMYTNAAVPSTKVAGNNYLPALISLGVLYFMMGLVTCLNDTLVPYFRKGFSLSYAESSLVQFYFFLTYGIFSIPAGKVVERIGYKNGMVAGFGIAAFGALLFFPAATAHQYAIFLAALFVIAIGIVVLQVAANPYVTTLGPEATASARLNIVQGVGALGTTVAPLFGSYFILAKTGQQNISGEALKYPYLGIALLLLLVAICVWRLPLPPLGFSEASKNAGKRKRESIYVHRNFKFGVPAIFVYVGAEVTVGAFLANYIADAVGIRIELANSYVTFYWGGMLVGRFAGSLLLRFIKAPVLLTVTSIMSVALIITSVFSQGYMAVWCMVSVGLCNSVMFAIIFSLSVEGLGSRTTQGSGLLSTAIVGGAAVSFAQGFLKDHFAWWVAFLVPVLCYVYLIFYGLSGHKIKDSLKIG